MLLAHQTVRILTFTLLLSCAMLFAPSSAKALELDEAKRQGLVGETTSGYIAAVMPAPPRDVAQLVEEINQRRREAYRAISNENGQPLNVVEKLAAEKLYSRLTSGEFYQSNTGAWQQK